MTGKAHGGRILEFYVDGFRRMTVGRTLWKIIALKLFIMFAILKLFFFPNYLQTQFENDTLRSQHVLNEITPSTAGSDN